MTYLIDSHCHLSSLSYEGKGPQNVLEALNRAKKASVSHMLAVACTVDEFTNLRDLTAPFNNIYLALGIHPLNLDEAPNWQESEIEKYLSDKRVIALGETGLDYHYAKETRLLQLSSFARHVELAKKHHKPLIIHTREASLDTIDIMKEHHAEECLGVMHCYCDSVEMLKKYLDMGFYVSFSGMLTFKAAENVRDAARYAPLDRIMVETDCPYLAPIPVRGIENEPAFVRYTLEFLAELKSVDARELAAVTSANFERLFRVELEEPKFAECLITDYKLKDFSAL